MGNVQLVKSRILTSPPSSSSQYSKLLRSNVLKCWGSSPKIRSRDLGFSATVAVALCGFVGIQAWRKREVNFGGSFSRLERHLHPFNKKYKHGGGGGCDVSSKFLPKWSLPPFLTPVHCVTSVGGGGEDTICNCCTCRAERLPPPSSPPSQNSDCECDECRASASKIPPSPSSPSTPPPPPPSSGGGGGNCSAPPPKRASCSGTGTGGPVSNKPCRHSSSSGSCSSGSEIDIQALSEQLGGLKQVNFYVDSDLSHCFLIKQASQITVDSVTRILTETAAAYDDYHEEYRRVMDMMMDTLQESRKACGADLEVIECKIVLIRAKVDEMKRRIGELDILLGSLEKLATASAETAFMANAEYASVAMSERLLSLNAEVKRLRDQSKEKERDMLELQSLIIVESGKSLK